MPRPDPANALGPAFPDPLVEGARSVLRQYGYRHRSRPDDHGDWPDMWELLRGDFMPRAAAYADLPDGVRDAARAYMGCQLKADHLLDRCRDAHARLHDGGIGTGAVEAYADAREAYEHSVEDFGAARERVEALLSP